MFLLSHFLPCSSSFSRIVFGFSSLLPPSLCGFDIGRAFQQGVRFDPDLPQTIRLEFAKSNTKVSKPKQTSQGGVGIPQVSPGAAHPATLLHPLTGRKFMPEIFSPRRLSSVPQQQTTRSRNTLASVIYRGYTQGIYTTAIIT